MSSNRRLLILLFVLITSFANSQDIDLLRLTYDKKSSMSEQTGVTVSNNGKFIAFSYSNKTIKVLNATNGRVVRVIDGVHSDLFELRFNYNATKLISVGSDNKVVILDITSGETLKSINLPYTVTRMAVSKNDDLIALGMLKGQVDIYDLKSYQLVRSILRKGNHVSGIDFDPKGETIAIAIASKKKLPVAFYNINSGDLEYETNAGKISSVNYNENGSIVYISGIGDTFNSVVEAFDVSTKSQNIIYSKFNKMSITLYQGVELYEKYILAVSVDKAFEVIDTQSARRTFTTLRDKTKHAISGKNFGVDIKRIFPLYDGKSYLVNYSNNNIVQIFNVETMSISCYIYSDANDNLVVASRDGRMDGSIDAMNHIYWSERKSNKETPLSSTFDQFFTPKLLPILLSGETNRVSAINLVEALEMAPSITISTPDTITTSTIKTIDIAYLTDANGDPVKEVIVAVNGKSMNNKTRGFKRVDNKITVDLVAGQNTVQLTAVSDKGYQSIPDQIIVNYSGAQAHSELYMLTIGLNEYRNPKYNLNYAQADASAFQNEVKEGSSTIFSSVKNFYIGNQDATKDKILSTFNEISTTIGPEDVFVFYYAGHGVMSDGDKPLFYVVPYGVTQLYGNNDILIEKAISADMLKSLSETIPAQKQLFVLDACQSGGMTEMLAMRGAAEEKAIAQLARSTGTYWLTASGSEQFATEFAELGHGLFTYTILEGLSGKADGGSMDKKITVKELSAYLNDRVPELSEEHKGQPQFPTSYGFGQDFPIVIVK